MEGYALIAATDIAWLNAAAVFALAGTLVALTKWGWVRIEKLHADQLTEAREHARRCAECSEAQIEHREALLERLLTAIACQNEINARVLARLEESHDDDE